MEKPLTRGAQQQTAADNGIDAAASESETLSVEQCTIKPADTELVQQVLEVAQLSVHNAVNICKCGAHVKLLAASDELFDAQGLCVQWSSHRLNDPLS